MTRETKIGLLVGLAFIIVIGVLLSDHIGTVTQPPPAQMDPTRSLREGVLAPGSRGNSQGSIALGEPKFRVPLTSLETTSDRQTPIEIGPGDTRGGRKIQIDGAPSASPAGGNGGGPIDGGNLLAPAGTRNETPVTALKQHTAEAGDTVYKLALKYLGSRSKANVDAILAVNPSLKANPGRIVIGQKYNIPEAAGSSGPSAASTATVENSSTKTPSSGSQIVYTTKKDDSLWRIAREQCGSGTESVVKQILELNKDVLKGKIDIQPNMKLKLPARQVAALR